MNKQKRSKQNTEALNFYFENTIKEIKESVKRIIKDIDERRF